MLDLYKNSFKKIEEKIAKIFSFLPFSPNQYTFASVFFVLVYFYFIIRQNLLLALISLLISSLLDFIDGAVARHKNMTSKIGAYLDTVCDRYVEGILLLGILFLPLPSIIFPPFVWIFLILFGSMMTTYAKAAAKEKELTNQEIKGGFFSRAERLISLIMALLLGYFNFYWTTYVLIFIAALTNFTAFQRIFFTIKNHG